MVLVNTKFRIMEILIMNSAGEFLPLNTFVLFTIGIGVGVNYSVWEAIWTTVKIFVCMSPPPRVLNTMNESFAVLCKHFFKFKFGTLLNNYSIYL